MVPCKPAPFRHMNAIQGGSLGSIPLPSHLRAERAVQLAKEGDSAF